MFFTSISLLKHGFLGTEKRPKRRNDYGSLSNRPQISMVYRLINHARCWKNTRRIQKAREISMGLPAQ